MEMKHQDLTKMLKRELPEVYALDVNVERAEDVLVHKRLLRLAEDPANGPAFEVHLVQVYPALNGNSYAAVHLDPGMKEDAQSSYFSNKQGMHPPPTFGSSPNLEAFRYHVEDGDGAANSTPRFSQSMHEITFSTVDSPKLLSQAGGYYYYRPCRIFLMYWEQFGIESAMLHITLGLCKSLFNTEIIARLTFFAHCTAWSCVWEPWEAEDLRNALEKEILKSKSTIPVRVEIQYLWTNPRTGNDKTPKKEGYATMKVASIKPVSDCLQYSTGAVLSKTGVEYLPDCVEMPSDGTDVWEIDTSQLKVEHKVASGSYGDLCQGTYCSQEVAIKVLEPERVSGEMLREFSQEAYIMRDLKTVNLLMDENEVVKVADFGVARVQNQPGVMTAETGTYRWMAPEAEVFSFGIVAWELLSSLTGEQLVWCKRFLHFVYGNMYKLQANQFPVTCLFPA
ncbi:hypothetical protein DKX38_011334 [Salix brachista]|uniref:Protein kinase domain-containing protein n=1 Tax=Salix brachista TaxID=2182728 RepID=A0A5N5LZ49_9ROSI|nr:hypothetical protein DKX38_011334 [Salix brachista]